MTTTDAETVQQRQRAPVALHQPSPSALRRSAAIRLAIAVVASGAITAAAIVGLWGPLRGKSEVIGYPIVSDFNPYNYLYAYVLVVVLLPILALLIFLGLTWFGPRVGLARPPSRGRLRPVAGPGEEEPSVDPELSFPTYDRIASAARVAVVGVVLGLEVGVASTRMWASVLLVGVGYSLAVGLGSIALRPLLPAQPSWQARLAAVNSLGIPLTVAGLSLVSAHTEVQILSGNTVHHYPWFPAWLGVPLAAALFGWILVLVRRARPAAAAIERRAILLVAAPVALFVIVARLPGDLGQVGLFEQGQLLTETMVLGHGWLPWRDVVLTHGLLGDVAGTAVGWGLFGNSYWSAIAGSTLILYPLAVVASFALLGYLVRRSWPLVLVAGLIYLDTWLGPADTRYLLWPLILLFLAVVLKHPTRVRATALGVLVVAQAIVTPEMAPSALVVAAVLAAYEWYWWPPGMRWVNAFQRTIWLAVGAAVSTGAFLIYMASQGAVGDVISVTFNLTAGHFAQGVPPSANGLPQWRYDFVVFAPVVAILISFAYAVVRLRLRRPFLLADWPMAAAALYVLFYYSKFLARMDFAHAYEPFMLAAPLMIYIVYRAVGALERWIRSRLPRRTARLVPAHPVSIAVLIFFAVYFWGPLHTAVQIAPANYRPPAPAPPIARVGYGHQFDTAAFEDLQRIVNAYLGPHDKLMDLTNEAALFYYFLDRNPSSRWFLPVGIVDTPALQRSLIGDLRRAPPKLIVFDDTDTKMVGLPSMDGVPGSVFLYMVSRWVLEHYRPLVESHGRTIYALPGVPPISSLHLKLHQRPTTVGLPFLGQACLWGDSPSFLTGPAEPPSGAQSVPARTVARQGQVTFGGWAGNRRDGQPVREVIATFNGRIVGRATPDIPRPDVLAAGYPAGFRRSGFRLSIPKSANATKALKVFAIGRDGSVAELGLPNVPVQGAVARIGSRTVALQPNVDVGHVDTESASQSQLQLQPPPGSTWSDFRWLEVDALSFGFLPGTFNLSDQPAMTAPGHMVSFSTIATSPHRYVIPVTSCPQWRGYGSRRLFLTSLPGQAIGGVQLIR